MLRRFRMRRSRVCGVRSTCSTLRSIELADLIRLRGQLRRFRLRAVAGSCAADLPTGGVAHATQTPPVGKSCSTPGRYVRCRLDDFFEARRLSLSAPACFQRGDPACTGAPAPGTVSVPGTMSIPGAQSAPAGLFASVENVDLCKLRPPSHTRLTLRNAAFSAADNAPRRKTQCFAAFFVSEGAARGWRHARARTRTGT